jgi:hypothetical protein
MLLSRHPKRLARFATGALACAVSLGAAACPSINALGNFAESEIVGASYSTAGGTTTFHFSSADRSPIISGVPGLIEYCVYPASGAMPSDLDALADGFDASPWTTSVKPNQGYFSFKRPKGNPTNVPLSGQTDYPIGQATWTGGASLLLHINDAEECNLLYGRNPGTCWVKPNLEICTPETTYGEDPECFCTQHPEAEECETCTPETTYEEDPECFCEQHPEDCLE